MREALRDIQLGVPFSSFATVLRAGGAECPERLGGSCIYQSQALANKLEKKGYTPKFIHLARDAGTHYAVVVQDGDLYFMDPSSIHHEPINLTTLFRERLAKIVDSFPVVRDIASTLRFMAVSENRFTLEKYISDGKRKDPSVVYHFDLNTISGLLPRHDDPYIAAKNEDRLLITVFDEDGTVVSVQHRFDCYLRKVKRWTKTDATEKAFSYSDGKFLGEIEDVADRLAMSSHELLGYIDKAVNVFKYVSVMGA